MNNDAIKIIKKLKYLFIIHFLAYILLNIVHFLVFHHIIGCQNKIKILLIL